MGAAVAIVIIKLLEAAGTTVMYCNIIWDPVSVNNLHVVSAAFRKMQQLKAFRLMIQTISSSDSFYDFGAI